jgi:hypothetical protein
VLESVYVAIPRGYAEPPQSPTGKQRPPSLVTAL